MQHIIEKEWLSMHENWTHVLLFHFSSRINNGWHIYIYWSDPTIYSVYLNDSIIWCFELVLSLKPGKKLDQLEVVVKNRRPTLLVWKKKFSFLSNRNIFRWTSYLHSCACLVASTDWKSNLQWGSHTSRLIQHFMLLQVALDMFINRSNKKGEGEKKYGNGLPIQD